MVEIIQAKERKQEILRLREDLNNAEGRIAALSVSLYIFRFSELVLVADASEFDLFPQNAACKCYFFDRLGNLSPTKISDD